MAFAFRQKGVTQKRAQKVDAQKCHAKNPNPKTSKKPIPTFKNCPGIKTWHQKYHQQKPILAKTPQQKWFQSFKNVRCKNVGWRQKRATGKNIPLKKHSGQKSTPSKTAFSWKSIPSKNVINKNAYLRKNIMRKNQHKQKLAPFSSKSQWSRKKLMV